jgi:hypothetical protein
LNVNINNDKIYVVDITNLSITAASTDIDSYVPKGFVPIAFKETTSGFTVTTVWRHPNNNKWMLTVRNWYSLEIYSSNFTVGGKLICVRT